MRILAVLLLLTTAAMAQDTDALKKTISVLTQQRNAIMDGLAAADVRIAQAQEEIDRLKAEIEKLKAANAK